MREITLDKINCSYKNKRTPYERINSFINSGECYDGTVAVIYGLRRTGKTTLMEQLMLENQKHFPCLFLVANETEEETMEDVYKRLDFAVENGIKCVFLDEVTFISDFIENSALLADVYAKEGLRIILAGTDSLSFSFAEEHSLFDRTIHFSTTYIPFEEHCRVLETKDMDNYIEFGGLMKKGESQKDHIIHDYLSACKYLDEAVAHNIVRSLNKYTDYAENNILKEVTKKEMETVIHKLVERYSGVFNVDIFNKPLTKVMLSAPSDTKSFRDLVGEDLFTTLRANKKEIVREFAKIINADTSIAHQFDDRMIQTLENILIDLGVVSATLREDLSYTEEFGWRSSGVEREYYIIQPAIKYYHLQKAIEYVETNDFYNGLPEKGKAFINSKLEEQIKGDMTEQIVLYEVAKALPKADYLVCKPCFKIDGKSSGEYDMLIYDKKSNRYWGFEIKHTTKPYYKQYKNLENDKLTEILDYKFGYKENVCVLYNGTPFCDASGVFYLNISDFTKAISNNPDVGQVMDILTSSLPERDIYAEDNESLEEKPTGTEISKEENFEKSDDSLGLD